jgi:hypothetical protein
MGARICRDSRTGGHRLLPAARAVKAVGRVWVTRLGVGRRAVPWWLGVGLVAIDCACAAARAGSGWARSAASTRRPGQRRCDPAPECRATARRAPAPAGYADDLYSDTSRSPPVGTARSRSWSAASARPARHPRRPGCSRIGDSRRDRGAGRLARHLRVIQRRRHGGRRNTGPPGDIRQRGTWTTLRPVGRPVAPERLHHAVVVTVPDGSHRGNQTGFVDTSGEHP